MRRGAGGSLSRALELVLILLVAFACMWVGPWGIN